MQNVITPADAHDPATDSIQIGSISSLLAAYATKRVAPEEVIEELIQRSEAIAAHNIWIEPPQRARIQPYLNALAEFEPTELPLWGVPFAVKDNIDVAGYRTTAACPAYAYQPDASAFVVQALVGAGAIPVGKTNLDQFATGLVGTRSPHGATTHPARPEHVSGGSSSGSAVAVSAGLVSFALGTDTAGSGRVPAAFNELVGFKPSIGLISTEGVVPACRSIDCVSIFAGSVADARRVAEVAVRYNESDESARKNPFPNNLMHVGQWQGPLTLGVLAPEDLEFFGDDGYAEAYQQTIGALSNADVQLKTIRFAPFAAAARELYEGPWVAERYLAAKDILQEQPEAMLAVTRTIIAQGAEGTATEVFASQYALAALRRQCTGALAGVDALLTPTVGKHPKVSEVEADPIEVNSQLGTYTNFMNLLDFCGVAVPGMRTPLDHPFGVTLIGDRLDDAKLLSIAARVESLIEDDHGEAPTGYVEPNTLNIAVCGAHLSGLPLNHQLLDRGAQLQARTQTTAAYRLYALAGGPPQRPGLIRDKDNGSAIEVEVWQVPTDGLASFLAGIPAPLGIGKVELADGSWCSGFICEAAGLEGAVEVTSFRSWRNYIASL